MHGRSCRPERAAERNGGRLQWLRAGVTALFACGARRASAYSSLTIKNANFTLNKVDLGYTLGTMTVALKWSPCSSHIFALDLSGRIYVSPTAEPGKISMSLLFDFNTDTFNWEDHGATDMELHPNFPSQPYIFILYSADPGNVLRDNCFTNYPPTSRGYGFCRSEARLERLTVATTYGTAASGGANVCQDFSVTNRQVLMTGWCSNSETHAQGSLAFWEDGDLLATFGDQSQYGLFDIGIPDGTNTCFDPAQGFPQGKFRSQRMDFLHGKILKIYQSSLLKNDALVQGTDFRIVARGLRNPFALTLAANGDVYVGDVGDSTSEEINRVPRSELLESGRRKLAAVEPLNFGWPCFEGASAITQAEEKMWITQTCPTLNASTVYSCQLCADVWPCATGSAGCSLRYRPPVFQYRDKDHPITDCGIPGGASITALNFFNGSNPVFGSKGQGWMPYNLWAGDWAAGCIWYFPNKRDLSNPAGYSIDFTKPKVMATGFKPISLNAGPDGYLYSTQGQASTGSMFRHGVAGVGNPPTAYLAVSVVNSDGTLTPCGDNGCQVVANSTLLLDGSASHSGSAALASFNYSFGDGSPTFYNTTTGDIVPTVRHTYVAAATRLLKITVTDLNGNSDYATVTVVVGGSLVIAFDPPSYSWGAGTNITFVLQSVGLVPPVTDRQVLWTLEVHHCGADPCTGALSCHPHMLNINENPATGNFDGLVGSFRGYPHGLPSQMNLVGTLTLAGGSTVVVSAQTHCQIFNVTIAAKADGVLAPGWSLTVVAVSTATSLCSSPCVQGFMANSTATLLAPEIQYRAGNAYAFQNWVIAEPGGDSYPDTNLYTGFTVDSNLMTATAMYSSVNTVVNTTLAAPPALIGAGGYYGLIEVIWSPQVPSAWDYVMISVLPKTGTGDYSSAMVAGGQAWAKIAVPTASAQYFVKLAGYSSNAKTFSNFTAAAVQVATSTDPSQLCFTPYTPYLNGPPAPIPGKINFEEFDEGGQGISYYDTTPGSTGLPFRSNTDVDFVSAPSGYGVAASADEWLAYTVMVEAAGSYVVTVQLSVSGTSAAGTGIMFLNIDQPGCDANGGTAVATINQTDATAGWVDYQAPIVLPGGRHVLRFCRGAGAGTVNIDHMVIAPPSAPSPAPSPMPTSDTQSPTVAKTTVAPTTATTASPTVAPTRMPTTRKPTTNKPTVQPGTATAQPTTNSFSTAMPTLTPTASPTAQPSAQPTPQPSLPSTATPTASPSGNPTWVPTVAVTSEPTSAPSLNPTATPTSAASSTLVPSSSPSLSPTSSPTKITTKPTLALTGKATSQPSSQPTAQPTEMPTSWPTTASPTFAPSFGPSPAPSTAPTDSPTWKPTVAVTSEPTFAPSLDPTATPTSAASSTLVPSSSPSLSPTSSPTKITRKPTLTPTGKATSEPSSQPTAQPTAVPTGSPATPLPTMVPSLVPSSAPTDSPTWKPSFEPTQAGTLAPSFEPSGGPTYEPTAAATAAATAAPTTQPSPTSGSFTVDIAASPGTGIAPSWQIDVAGARSSCISPCSQAFLAQDTATLTAPVIQYRQSKVYSFQNWVIVGASGATTTDASPNGTTSFKVVSEKMTATAMYSAISPVTDATLGSPPNLLGIGSYYGTIQVVWAQALAPAWEWVLVALVAKNAQNTVDYSRAVPASGQTYTDLPVPNAQASYIVRLAGYSSTLGVLSSWTVGVGVTSSADPALAPPTIAPGPYPATGPAAIPGRIQYEEYDKGIAGLAYYDNVPGSQGVDFRPGTDVDFVSVAAPPGLAVAADNYEWLTYTVNVATAGNYGVTMRLNVPTKGSGRPMYFSVDTRLCKDSANVPVGMIWNATFDTKTDGYVDVAAVVPMPAGIHLLRVCRGGSSVLYLDYMDWVAAP